MLLLDTNILSEMARRQPSVHVERWLDAQSAKETFVSSVSLMELWCGCLRLPEGRRRDAVERFLRQVTRQYGESLLAFGLDEAMRTAEAKIDRVRRGLGWSTPDLQIAGTALAGSFILATRNVRDFAGIEGLRVIDPFQAEPVVVDAVDLV